MGESRDKLLSTAGGLFVTAGFIAAFTGGLYGLASTRPELVIFSVLLLMGYSVVGALLMNKGARYFRIATPAAAVLIFATLMLLREDVLGFVDDEFAHFFLYPGLALVLSYAGGAVLTHAVEQTAPRTPWPGKRSTSLNTVMHAAAFAPIWSAFTLLYLLGPGGDPLLRLTILAGSVGVAIACVVGGYASTRAGHPSLTVTGATLAFLASAIYLYQFMAGGGDRDARGFGQFVALLGLLLSAFPTAIGTLAWIQAANDDGVEDEAQPAP